MVYLVAHTIMYDAAYSQSEQDCLVQPMCSPLQAGRMHSKTVNTSDCEWRNILNKEEICSNCVVAQIRKDAEAHMLMVSSAHNETDAAIIEVEFELVSEPDQCRHPPPPPPSPIAREDVCVDV